MPVIFVVAQSWLTLCDPMSCSMPGSLSFTISQRLFKFMSIESVMPSNHLILCLPLLLLPSIFPNMRVFSSESVLRIRWPNYWSFSISPSNDYSGLISFRIDWLDLLAVQGVFLQSKDSSQESSPAPQFKSIRSLLLSLLNDSNLTSIHDYGKKHSFDYREICWQNNVSAF